jgi:hypothetical protein
MPSPCVPKGDGYPNPEEHTVADGQERPAAWGQLAFLAASSSP